MDSGSRVAVVLVRSCPVRVSAGSPGIEPRATPDGGTPARNGAPAAGQVARGGSTGNANEGSACRPGRHSLDVCPWLGEDDRAGPSGR
jgi:hypothetical protein